jgi:hypothetical protein
MPTLFLLCLMFFQLASQAPSSGASISQEGQDHIRAVVASLPLDSSLRSVLLQGAHGDGVRFDWMDRMKDQGVKRVLAEAHMSSNNDPSDIQVVRIVYFRNYEPDCSQVLDDESLKRIRASGLEKKLMEVVRLRAVSARTNVFEPSSAKSFVAYVELFSDEWLPASPPVVQGLTEWKTLEHDAILGDELGVSQHLAGSKLDPERLDTALFAAAQSDNSCTIKPLVDHGANVNARTRDGATPLMTAAGSGKGRNVRVLLELGADAEVKDSYGRTALYLARRGQFPEVARVLEDRTQR